MINRRTTRLLLSVLAAALVLCSCGSNAGEGVSGGTVAARDHVNGRGPQDATGRVELAPKRPGADCGRDERSEVSPGTPSPADAAAAETPIDYHQAWFLGTSRLYPETVQAPPRAPRGYVPVYLSHYGRHGSRYTSERGLYEGVAEVLGKASRDGMLTPLGAGIWERYSAILPFLIVHEGELTPLGAKQHGSIAERMVHNYPRLFKGRGTRIVANSTNLERTMLSMLHFNQALLSWNPHLNIQSDASKAYMGRINQHNPANPRVTPEDVRWKSPDAPWRPGFDRWCESLLDWRSFCGRLFKDTAYVQGICDPVLFERHFFSVAQNLPGCPVPDCGFMEAFGDDELQLLGRLENYTFYVEKSMYPRGNKRGCYLSEAVLGDIIDRAAEDISDGVRVRLRFGHDGCIMALLSMMGIDGWNAIPDDPAEAWKFWDVSRVPMACNLQLVFFAPRKQAARPAASDILVLMMLNEEPLRLPLDACDGFYYRWSDFLEHYISVLQDARNALDMHL